LEVVINPPQKGMAVSAVRICLRKDAMRASKIWAELYDVDAHSFFLSWHWIEAWLTVLPEQFNPYLLVADADGVTVFAAIVGNERTVMGACKACIGEVDDYYFDDLVIEQNGFLLGDQSDIPALSEVLEKSGIDIFSLSKTSNEFLNTVQARMDLSVWRHTGRSVSTHFVDLSKVRASTLGYLELLSRNRRAQIRKSVRLYEARGPLVMETASNLIEAETFFEELVLLHQQEWQARGRPGTFASEFNLGFHQKLIKSTFSKGVVALYRLRCGDQTIGVIYGFHSRNEFLYYQSGFVYESDNRYRPGFVSHALLVEQLAGQGLARYDFLAGESDYKRSLGTDQYLTQSIQLYSGSFTSRLAFVWEEQIKPRLRRLRPVVE